MRRILTISSTTLLVGCLALTACSGGGGPAPVTTVPSVVATSAAPPSSRVAVPSPAPTIPADVPLTGKNLHSPGEKPPLMPVAATKHTSAGALAFAVFFMEAVDWGYATSDPAYMNHYFQKTCLECRNIRTYLTSAITRKAYYRGSRIAVIDAKVIPAASPTDGKVQVLLHTNVSAWDVVDGAGRSLGAEPAYRDVVEEIHVAWIASHWVITDLQTTRSG